MDLVEEKIPVIIWSNDGYAQVYDMFTSAVVDVLKRNLTFIREDKDGCLHFKEGKENATTS